MFIEIAEEGVKQQNDIIRAILARTAKSWGVNHD
jgi:hypothetical protein